MSRHSSTEAVQQTPQVRPYNRRAYLAPLPGSGGQQGNGRGRFNPNIQPGASRGGPAPQYPQVTARQRVPDRGPWADTGGANDNVIIQDRHPYLAAATEITGRNSGLKDPIPDGPVMRVLRMLTRDWTMWQGSDATRAFDPPRDYNKWGMQDGTVTTVFGGQKGYFRPYGTQVLTDVVPRNTIGSVQIPAGPPHGLHTQTVSGRRVTLKSYRKNAQQVPGRQDRLSNSRRAGQSYSATTRAQGA